MTLDAMDWVWRHATARGNARLVLLAVADAITGPEATARMGTAELTRRLAAGKGTVVEAVARAVAGGELEIAEPAKGSRAATYRLPGAVGYSRVSGLDSRPQTDRSEIRTGSGLRSGIQTANAPDSGLESGPQRDQEQDGLWSEIRTGSGLESGPHHSPIERVNEGGSDAPARPAVIPGGIPDFARPLVDTLTASGVVVKWSLAEGEWFTLHAMVQRSGVDMLAAEAVKVAARTNVGHARYFLRAWRDLPPAPAAGTAPVAPQTTGPNVIPLDAGQPRRSRAQRTADELALILAREAQQ